ncbi:MAG: MFS transporter [Actinomycetes bacterium]
MTADATLDAAPPPAEPLRLFSPQYRALVVGVVGVVVAVAFEAIAVATAMPVAARELDGLPAYGLAFSVFLTASLLGMVVAGEVSDRGGPVRPFAAAAVVFALGLLLAGLSTSMWLLVVARAVQGIGAGLNIVALYVVVARAFPSALRPRVFSAVASGWILPSLVGPPVAGLLADHVSWRWVFLGVLPLLLGAVLLVGPHLRGLDGPPPSQAPDDPVGSRRRNRVPAAAVAALGAGLLQYGGQVLTDRPVPAVLMVGAALVLLALGVPRLLPAGAFRLGRGLPTVVVLRGVLAGAFFGAETFLPLMLVEQRSLATTLAGASLTGAALTWSLGAWLQGRPGLRTPRSVLLTVGFLLVLAGIGTAALATSHAVPVVAAAVGWTVAGLGMGLGLTSLSVLVLELSPPGEQGANASALQVSDALGSIVLIGAGGAVFAGYAAGTVPGSGGPGVAPFLVIDAVMAAVCVAGALVAGRVRPAGDTR